MENNNLNREILEKQIESVNDIATDIKEVASEIKILAINAAIESAHAAAGIKTMMEMVLNGMMTSICRMLTRLLEAKKVPLDEAGLHEFAAWVGVDDIFITDEDAVVVGTNVPGGLGWRFPDDPKTQASTFRELIKQKDGVVTQAIQVRDIDGALYKFVGVSRTDQPGIVQVGFRAETITRYQTEIGSVFGVLANEIKLVEGRVSKSARQMKDIAREYEKTITNLKSE